MPLEPGRVTEIYVPRVTADDTDANSFGSGYLVTRRLILTARHVVERAVPTTFGPAPERPLAEDALDAASRGAPLCRVRLLSRDKASFGDAVVVWAHPDLDVAMLAATGRAWTAPSNQVVNWTDITGVEAARCTAVGFPAVDRAAAGDVRETRQLFGEIPPLSQYKSQRWSVLVDHGIGAVSSTVGSSWAGMSGAAVFVEDALVGIIETDVDPGDPTRLELWALPARCFAMDPDFVAWLVADSGARAWNKAPVLGRVTFGPSDERGVLDVAVPRTRPLVGRAELLSEVRDRLLAGEDTALVSGLPGAGKTALAVNAVRDAHVVEEWPDGRLWLAVGRQDSAGLSHWVHRMTSWAQQLQVRPDEIAQVQADEDGSRLAELVSDALGDRRALLVFDDVWLREDALTFKDIGTNCVRLLTTRIPRVAALFADNPTPVDELDRAASIALVEAQCPGAHARFTADLDAVIDVAGGLPLTLVLVGTRLREELAENGSDAAREFLRSVPSAGRLLDLELDLPKQELPLLGKRHRTLQAVISLTTDGLDQAELQALRALTAFPPKANTFSRDAASYVAGDRGPVNALRSVGLIELADAEGRRLTMHQAIVDFARRGQEGDADAFQRMAEYFIEYAEREVRDSPSDTWVGDLEPEFENIRSALEWAIRSRASYTGLRMMAALWPYWYERSLFARARELANRVLSLNPPEGMAEQREYMLLRAKVLNDTGNFAYNMASLVEAERHHSEALRIRTVLGEEGLTAGSKNNLGLIERERGRYAAGRALFEEALEINERTHHEQWRLWRGMNLNNPGITSYRLAAFDEARDRQIESVRQFEEIGHVWARAMARLDLAETLVAAGSPGARELIRELLQERHQARDEKAVATALRARGGLGLLDGDGEGARRQFIAAFQLSLPLADGLGQGAALQGMVLACAQTHDCRFGARASGVLQAFGELTSVAPAPWRAEKIRDAQASLRRTHREEYESDFSASYAIASTGMPHFTDALGRDVLAVSPGREVLDILDEQPPVSRRAAR